MGGDGKFKGASGMGIFSWTQGAMDPQDQTTAVAFGVTKKNWLLNSLIELFKRCNLLNFKENYCIHHS